MLEKKIQQVLDPHHRNWVQGGVFRELREESNCFNSTPIYLPPPNSIKNLGNYLEILREIRKLPLLLFSSLTPLENYLRFMKKPHSQVIGLWFTHKEGEFNSREIRCLRSTDVIFLHSNHQSLKLREVTSSKQVEILAAIDPERFSRPSIQKPRIVWVGTAVERKRPTFLLKLASELSSEEFLILGKRWSESKYWKTVNGLKNIRYEELSGALTSEILDGNDIFLMTSEIEGGPMPLLESLAAGLTPICTNTGFVERLFLELGIDSRLIVEPEIQAIKDTISLIRSGEIYLPFNARSKTLEFNFDKLSKIIHNALLAN